jgi:hypothetical protein
MTKLKSLVLFALILNLAACGTASMDLGDEDTSTAGVDSVGSGTDTTSGADANTSTDNGPKPCVDKDGDGYCDASPQPGDCNDNDKEINPGMTEKCGDNVDNNCNGHIDEGCAVPTPTASNSLTITYPTKYERTLNVQVTSNKSDLGLFWNHTSATVVDYSVTETFSDADLQASCVYVLWNVIDKNPSTPYQTACVGNGPTANMDQNAVPTLKLGNETFTKSNQITWSHPGGTSKGCAGLFVRAKPGANCGF